MFEFLSKNNIKQKAKAENLFKSGIGFRKDYLGSVRIKDMKIDNMTNFL